MNCVKDKITKPFAFPLPVVAHKWQKQRLLFPKEHLYDIHSDHTGTPTAK